jgi:bacteriorhodopsin
MAPLPEGVTYGQWLAVYNALSFGIAAMGSGTIFYWLQIPNVNRKFRTALTITGLVTAIATYHYVRIFNSWVGAFAVNADAEGEFQVSLSGQPFNDAYRYVDWLLTVPLLLIELILVMGLPAEQTASLSWQLGLASAVMVALGYPGEIQEDPQGRWLWWGLSMLPFCFVLYQLLIGLGKATESQPEAARGLIGKARLLTAVSWLTYPGVYIVKMMGIGGATATAAEQIGYSIADVVAKAVFGVLIWAIAAAKSGAMEKEGLLQNDAQQDTAMGA